MSPPLLAVASSERHYRRFWMKMTRSGYNKNEPVDLTPDAETPIFLDLLNVHRTELDYSLQELALLTGDNYLPILLSNGYGRLTVVA